MREFLDAIFPNLGNAVVEMRMIGGRSGAVVCHWHHSADEIMSEAKDYAGSHDVYFGVIPRYATGGSKADDVLAQTTVLWMDLDPKGWDKAYVFRKLSSISPPPQIIVDSGSGYHAYWLLKYPVAWRQAEMVMRGMANTYAGDRVYDQARILRLPGTLNHKTTPPKPVRLLRLDTLAPRYSIGDFVDFVDSGPADSAPTWKEVFGEQKRQRQDGLGGEGMPPWLLTLVETDPGKGERSEHVFHVVACLVELGWTDDQIEEIVRDYPEGVGAKYAEKGASGHRYLSYPLAEARRRVNG